jgi:probable phosphoglycerate mutase
MTILLVRHGETDGNALRIMQRPDVPLNQRGIRQAALLGERLLAHGFAYVLCSDLLRARMTAEPLRRAGVPIEDTPLLAERNFGDLRGTPYDQLAEDPYAPNYVPPNGESIPVFLRRVADAFALIAERRRGLAGPLVVVTHGLVCRAIIEYHTQLASPLERYDNTGVTEIAPEPPYAVRYVNAIEHLATAPPHGDPVSAPA